MTAALRTDVRHLALAGLIDSAAVFPPARDPLPEAVAGYQAARGSATSWLFRRFLVPAGQLAELGALTGPAAGPVGLVATGPGAVSDVRAALAAIPQGLDDRVDDVEVRCPEGGGALRLLRPVLAGRPHPLTVFVELDPAGQALAKELAALAAWTDDDVRAGAKLRCGGTAPGDVPADALVADFLVQARGLGLPLKATQGLHHPFRTPDPLTGDLQHGFVNLLAAVALTGADTEAVVAESDPAAFTLDGATLAWRDHEAGADAVAAARAIFTGFGSCSLSEPLDDLRSAGLLPQVAP